MAIKTTSTKSTGSCIVMKFGGTSIKDGPMMERAIEIIKSRADRNPLVVFSAMGGVTDLLHECAERAHQGDENGALRLFANEIEQRHRDAVEYLISDDSVKSKVLTQLQEYFSEIKRLLSGLAILGELTMRSLDSILTYGERMSTFILANAMRARDLDVSLLDAREFLKTDHQYGQANPISKISEGNVQKMCGTLLESGKIVISQGFTGSTEEGVTTTLGRGGSDYSAAILGAYLNAAEIEIWTDVDGVMTADPRVVPEAHTISELSYEEAAELSYFGAKVLHSKTVRPAVEKNIPIRILNTFNPESLGTLIHKDAGNHQQTIKAITCVAKLSQINVEGRGMLGVPGVAGRVFSTVADVGASVLMISQSSSEQSICFVVEQESADRSVEALNEEFDRELAKRNIDKIHAESGIVIITAVGMGVKDTPGIFARVFGALGNSDINVRSIAQGSSEHNLSIVVLEEDANEALRQIHKEFKLDQPS